VVPGEQDYGGGDRDSADEHGGPDSDGRGDQAAAERAECFGTLKDGAVEAGDPAQQVVGHLPLAHGDRGHVEEDPGCAAGSEHRGGDDHVSGKPENGLAGRHDKPGGQQRPPRPEPPGNRRSEPADPDPADRADGHQEAVHVWLLVQDLDHVQDKHGNPGGIHGGDDANGDRDVPDGRVPP
jgi:hypothetical protein